MTEDSLRQSKHGIRRLIHPYWTFCRVPVVRVSVLCDCCVQACQPLFVVNGGGTGGSPPIPGSTSARNIWLCRL